MSKNNESDRDEWNALVEKSKREKLTEKDFYRLHKLHQNQVRHNNFFDMEDES